MREEIRIGTDLCSIARVERIWRRFGDVFIDRICTEREKAVLRNYGAAQLVRKLAAVYALKEAGAKMLGCGLGEHLGFGDMEVIYDDRGKPRLVFLQGHVFQKFSSMDVSVTHEGPMLQAVVVGVRVRWRRRRSGI